MRRLGIMQGRLSQKPSDKLQSFPMATWRDEFGRATALGLDAIEWLVDTASEGDNPLFDDTLVDDIRELEREAQVAIESLCAHAFISGDLSRTGQQADDAVAFLHKLLARADLLDVKLVVLPILEAASLQSMPARRQAFVDNLGKALRDSNSQCRIALESDLVASEALDLIKDIADQRVGVCCDLGNAASLGHDVAEEISQLGVKIFEVHIKDRQTGGRSVRLGEGDVDFKTAFAALDATGFDGPAIMETPVGNDWQAEARHNVEYSRNLSPLYWQARP